MKTIRETSNFRASESPRGARIEVKPGKSYPKCRVVNASDWKYLAGLNDSSFETSCVWEFGIGLYARP